MDIFKKIYTYRASVFANGEHRFDFSGIKKVWAWKGDSKVKSQIITSLKEKLMPSLKRKDSEITVKFQYFKQR